MEPMRNGMFAQIIAFFAVVAMVLIILFALSSCTPMLPEVDDNGNPIVLYEANDIVQVKSEDSVYTATFYTFHCWPEVVVTGTYKGRDRKKTIDYHDIIHTNTVQQYHDAEETPNGIRKSDYDVTQQ